MQLVQKIGHAPRPAPETKLFLEATIGFNCSEREKSPASRVRSGKKALFEKARKGKKAKPLCV